MEEQLPSIGRTVIYNHPGSADGMHPAKQSPAIIQKVNDDSTVELFVMSVYGGIFFNHDVREASYPGDPSTWEWPQRV